MGNEQLVRECLFRDSARSQGVRFRCSNFQATEGELEVLVAKGVEAQLIDNWRFLASHMYLSECSSVGQLGIEERKRFLKSML